MGKWIGCRSGVNILGRKPDDVDGRREGEKNDVSRDRVNNMYTIRYAHLA